MNSIYSWYLYRLPVFKLVAKMLADLCLAIALTMMCGTL